MKAGALFSDRLCTFTSQGCTLKKKLMWKQVEGNCLIFNNSRKVMSTKTFSIFSKVNYMMIQKSTKDNECRRSKTPSFR